MKELLLFEFYNILKRKEIRFVFIILLSVSIVDFLGVCFTYKGYPIQNVRAFYDQFILITPYSLIGKQLYVILFPIIVSIIYSDSLIVESKNNINNYIYTRTNKTKHLLAKVISNFIAVFIIVFICLFINYILVRYTFPVIGGDNNYAVDTATLYSIDGMKSLYNNDLTFTQKMSVYDQRIYLITLIIVKSITGGIISTLSLALSTILNKSRIMSILTTFIALNIMIVFEQIIDKTHLVRVFTDFKYDSILIYIFVSSLVIFVSTLFFRNWKSKDVL